MILLSQGGKQSRAATSFVKLDSAGPTTLTTLVGSSYHQDHDLLCL